MKKELRDLKFKNLFENIYCGSSVSKISDFHEKNRKKNSSGLAGLIKWVHHSVHIESEAFG